MLRVIGATVAAGFALVASLLGMRPVHAVVISALIYLGVFCVLRTHAGRRRVAPRPDGDATSDRLDR